VEFIQAPVGEGEGSLRKHSHGLCFWEAEGVERGLEKPQGEEQQRSPTSCCRCLHCGSCRLRSGEEEAAAAAGAGCCCIRERERSSGESQE